MKENLFKGFSKMNHLYEEIRLYECMLVSTEVDTEEATKLEVNTAEAKNSVSGLDLDKREAAVPPLDVSQDTMLPGSSSMELFPGEGDGDDLSIPELCMDSASDDDNPLAGNYSIMLPAQLSIPGPRSRSDMKLWFSG